MSIPGIFLPAIAKGQGEEPVLHRIRGGETVFRLAIQYQVSRDSIIGWNKIRNNMIYAGRDLIVGYRKTSIQKKPGTDSLELLYPGTSTNSNDRTIDSLRAVIDSLQAIVDGPVTDTGWSGHYNWYLPDDRDSAAALPDTATLTDELPGIQIEGYVDVYYARYSNESSGGYEAFEAVDVRSNSFGLNTFQISLEHTDTRLRGIARLHFGDLANAAWPADLKFVRQAHFGIHLAKKLWLDAGLFPVHFGAESVPPKDNMLSTIAILTFHEPFYQAGLRLGFEESKKIYACFHVVNGYNLFTNFNKSLAAGLSLKYNVTDHFSISYGNLLSDELDFHIAGHRYRFYQNIAFYLSPFNNFEILAGLDLGTEEGRSIADTTKSAMILGGLTTLKYHVSPSFGFFVRGEFFQDPDGVISARFLNSDSALTGLKTNGFTAGLEYKARANHYARLECRYLQADPKQTLFQGFFDSGSGLVNRRMEIVVTTGIWFSN